jgi:hypothetical protein
VITTDWIATYAFHGHRVTVPCASQAEATAVARVSGGKARRAYCQARPCYPSRATALRATADAPAWLCWECGEWHAT